MVLLFSSVAEKAFSMRCSGVSGRRAQAEEQRASAKRILKGVIRQIWSKRFVGIPHPSILFRHCRDDPDLLTYTFLS